VSVGIPLRYRLAARSLIGHGTVDRYWLTCSLIAAAMLALTAVLPLWHMHFYAPQYPKGLHLTAYGTRLQGDLAELNALNHYIGVTPIDSSNIPELALFPFLIAGLVAVVAAGGFLARRRLLKIAALGAVWLFLIGFLADIQWWLYRAGHELNADAPVRVDHFTPRVLGKTNVVNFSSEAIPVAGLYVMLAAALLLTIGPPLARFLYTSWQNTDSPAAEASQPRTSAEQQANEA